VKSAREESRSSWTRIAHGVLEQGYAGTALEENRGTGSSRLGGRRGREGVSAQGDLAGATDVNAGPRAVPDLVLLDHDTADGFHLGQAVTKPGRANDEPGAVRGL
jgi:hypothetical protein